MGRTLGFLQQGLCLVLVIGLGATGKATPLPLKAERTVDYRIRVRLDAKLKQLAGEERVTWHNPSTDAVPDLWFHLYLNAFKNSKTTFYKDRSGALPADSGEGPRWGWIDVNSIKLQDGTDLTSRVSYQRPDDGNLEDQTVIKVQLPTPVPPGGDVTFTVSFKAQLPPLLVRTGYKNNSFMVGQWFPKLGVYEPAGMRGRQAGGWNCHQFHATTEFYADFGHFQVEVNVPTGFKVGATGQLRSSTEDGKGRSSYVFEQDNVHDFAWTTSPDYVIVHKNFSATSDVSRDEYRRVAAEIDRPVDEVRLSDVDMIFLMQTGHMSQLARYEEGATLALKWFGLWYGRYPYPTLTVVDPAAEGGGGMEYPTLITAGTTDLFAHWPFDRIRFPEMVTVHEGGHEWWYGMVGNNEFEEAWLDEGINSYSTGKVLESAYGTKSTLIDFLGIKLSEIDSLRLQNTPSRRYDRIFQPAWTYLSDYGFYSYTKPELMLRTLENYLGEKTMARIMRTYQEQWRFRHPATEDFIATANDVSGQDLNWFFDQHLKTKGTLDYEISSATTRAANAERGVFDRRKGRVTLPAKDNKGTKSSKDSKVQYRTEVVLRRVGETYFPVNVLLTFEDGHKSWEQWDGKSRWKKVSVLYSSRLSTAEIDPEHKVYLDVNWANNSRRVEPDRRASVSLAARALFWVQSLTSLLAAIS